MQTVAECCHYWLCSEPRDGVVHATCKHCGAGKEFPAWIDVPPKLMLKSKLSDQLLMEDVAVTEVVTEEVVTETVQEPKPGEEVPVRKGNSGKHQEFEANREHILEVCQRCGWVPHAAAKELGMCSSTLYGLLRKWEVDYAALRGEAALKPEAKSQCPVCKLIGEVMHHCQTIQELRMYWRGLHEGMAMSNGE